MPEVILPCPACGGTDTANVADEVDDVTFELFHFVQCESCGMRGRREYAHESAAIAAWNAMPRALTWTHEPPKVAGWYWFSIGKGHAVCLLVCADGKAKLAKDHFTDADMLGGEWAGPIAPPVEG